MAYYPKVLDTPSSSRICEEKLSISPFWDFSMEMAGTYAYWTFTLPEAIWVLMLQPAKIFLLHIVCGEAILCLTLPPQNVSLSKLL
jgi:hypothetical protein